ncbi:MAG: lytic transglycosylase domain-containing protein [Syntrophales bacterium]|jgi:soluble lytic murein transglycosylase|nr:lytic transglycosylase domain-containing protein [Syntrophales bacterium]MCK9528272.1 lytic transglycosylase domain-containing protein [Syntrophales bacterium]MDX9922404.1 lytic transglycosylase domain-containing protein [Syntrophales bacterium]
MDTAIYRILYIIRGVGLLVAGLYVLAAPALCPSRAEADIYLYKDGDGVYHFSDQPLSPEYRLFIRQWRPPASGGNHSSTAYEPYIDEASRKYNIDSRLLKAIVKVESNFNPRAVSEKGAVGLMQIMPENFAPLGLRDPYNPQENILAGARYLREMINRYGELSLALAAYNAGPGAVDRYRTIPPFSETQSYVTEVLHYYDSLRNR